MVKVHLVFSFYYYQKLYFRTYIILWNFFEYRAEKNKVF